MTDQENITQVCQWCLGLGYISDWDSQGRHDRPCECEAGRAYATQASKMLKRIADLTLELADARELLAARNLNTIFSSDIYTAMRERAEQAERELAVEQEANRNNVAMHCQQIADLTREMDEARAANAEFIDSIPEALAQYRCQHMVYENYDGGMALVDVFSIGSDIATIKPGLDELELLADFIQSYKPNPGQPILDRLAAQDAEIGRLRAACETFTELVSIPERNCSCHLSPPCRDCEEYGGLREADKAIREALAGRDAAKGETDGQ